MLFQRVKRKPWVVSIFLTACITATLLFFIFLNPSVDIDFKRIHLAPSGPYNKETLEKYRLKQLHLNGNDYIYSRPEGTTFKGDLWIMNGEEKRLDFSPHLKGTFTLFIEFFLLSNSNITFMVRHNNKTIAEHQFHKKQLFSLNHELTLAKGDRFAIVAGGNGIMAMGNPIFYKEKPAEERIHVFLICADTLRADHLPTYGYQRDTAPNIQDFSKESVVFENAYAHSPWTLPSHMSLFTSLNEYNHGVTKESTLFSDIHFLIEELSRSFAARSFNGGCWVRAIFGFYRGFDFYRSRAKFGSRTDSAKALFEHAIEDLEKNNFPRSFYFLHTYQTHAPYTPGHEFLTYFNPNPQYKKLTLPVVPRFKKMYEKNPEKFKKDLIDFYDACVRSFDYWFGAFIDYLKKKKIYDNAMIIFISDHGEEFFDHQEWGHDHSLYNELIRVPLIIKFPKNKFKGSVLKNEVGLIDIMPTILNWYNIDFYQNEMDGVDLIPLIKGKHFKRLMISSITNGFYSPADAFKISVLENNQKIILNIPYKKAKSLILSPSSKKFEFYNLLKDPAETFNLCLKQKHKIKKFRDLFDNIIKKGVYNLKRKGEKVVKDKKMKETLKTLGYL